MILVDTSVWIEIFRDKQGDIVKAYHKKNGSEDYALSRFNQLELLQGAGDQKEWELLEDYLSTQYYLEASQDNWPQIASLTVQTGFSLQNPMCWF